MRFVLDASVALKWELPEADSPTAIQLRRLFEADLHEFIAPDIFPIEFAHAISRAQRRNLIDRIQGAKSMERILNKLPTLFDALSLVERAFDLSSRMRIGVYDCLYLSLADEQGCQFVTADARLRVFPQVLLLSDFPFHSV